MHWGVLNLTALGSVGLLYASGGAVAVGSLRAMAFRTAVWLVLFGALAWMHWTAADPSTR